MITEPLFLQAAPPPDLAGLVKCFWEVAAPASAEPTLIVPDGSPELVVELGEVGLRLDEQGRVLSAARAVVAGQLTRAIELATPGGFHAFGIRLQPWGASALLGDTLPELTDETPAMDDVLGAAGRQLAGCITDASGFSQRVQHAQAWLRRHARYRAAAWLPWAGARLRAGGLPVAALAQQLQLSPRQLERVFLRSVGLAPKAFARQQRFAQAAQALDGARSLADLAQACGYADQAHMARDFRAFAGLAPSRLAQRLTAVSSALAGLGSPEVAFVQAAPGSAG